MAKENSKFNNAVRNIILIHRKKNKFTQEEMSEQLGISPRAYSGQENGEYGFSAITFAAFLSSVSLEDISVIIAMICIEMDWEMHPTVAEIALPRLEKSKFKSLHDMALRYKK